MELTPKQKNRLLAAADIVENGELAVVHKLIEFENTLENNTEKIDEAVSNAQQVGQGIIKEVQELKEEAQETLKSIRQPQDGHTPTDNELKALIVPLIPKVKDGKTPTPEEIISLIRPLIPEPRNGVSPTKEELISLIKQVIPDQTPEEIRDKLESLEGEERLDAAAIKNLPKLIESTELWRGGGGSRFLSQMLDLRITDPVSGDLLQYNNGYWTNTAFDNNGILSLNGLTGATQVFSVANGIAVNSSGTTHALSLGAITPSSVSVGNGTAAAPSYSFASNTGTGFFISGNSVRVSRSGTVQAQIGGGTQGIINLPATGGIGWTADADVVTVDTFLLRDAANTLAQRNGTNAQAFRVYNTYTDASNYERVGLTWNSNVFELIATNAGTGSARSLRIGTASLGDLAFRTNGSDRFKVDATNGHLLASADNTYDIGASGATRPRAIYVGSGGTFGTGVAIGSTSPGNTSLRIAQGSITGLAPVIDASTTWADAGTTFTGIKYNVTDTASGSVSLLMDLQVGGVSKFNVRKNGNLTYDGVALISGVVGRLQWQADGVLSLFDNATTSFGRLQFGGTTSSFPALGRTGAVLQALLADGSAYTEMRALGYNATGAAGFYKNNGVLVISSAAPTVSSGFGTSPSITANGTAAFIITIGTGGTDTGGVLTMPAATTGWNCHIENITATAANRANQRTVQTASTTTSITIQNQTVSTGAALAWTAGDILRVIAMAY